MDLAENCTMAMVAPSIGQQANDYGTAELVTTNASVDCGLSTVANSLSSVMTGPPSYLLICVTVFYVIIFVAGVVGNSLVMLVVWRNAEMRNTTNCFIVNLSVADLLVIVVCMPTALTVLHSKDVWLLGHVMCKIVPLLENTVTLTSVLTILAIAFERYHAICRPFRARFKCTLGRMTCMVACLWCAALMACIPFALMTKYHMSDRVSGSPQMMCQVLISSRWQRGYIVALTVCSYAIPLCTLASVYGVITRQLVRDTAAAQLRDDRQMLLHVRARKQVVVMLATVVVLFFVCLLPMHVLRLCSLYCSSDRIQRMSIEGYLNLLSFARVMLYLNSVVNPFCYSMISSKFRDAFRRVILRMNSSQFSYRSSSSNAGFAMRTRHLARRPPAGATRFTSLSAMEPIREQKTTHVIVGNHDDSTNTHECLCEGDRLFANHVNTSNV